MDKVHTAGLGSKMRCRQLRAIYLLRRCHDSKALAITSSCMSTMRFVRKCLKILAAPEQFLQILTTPPSWAEGLPIAAKVRVGAAVLKITQPKAMPDDAAPIAPEDLADEVAEETPIDIEEDYQR